jgi:hypothetical protein
MTDLTVARSILDQLGGARFVDMTGARIRRQRRQPDFQDRCQPEARQPSARDAHARRSLLGDVLPHRQGAADRKRRLLQHARSSVFRAHRPLHAIAAAGRIMNKTVREASKIGPCRTTCFA